jgi:hypothetical protein
VDHEHVVVCNCYSVVSNFASHNGIDPVQTMTRTGIVVAKYAEQMGSGSQDNGAIEVPSTPSSGLICQ